MSLSANIKLLRPHARQPFKLDVCFDLPAQGITALYGKSGSGKTTILRCIAGLEPQSESAIRFADHVWQTPAGDVFVPPEQRNVAYGFQENRLFPHLTVLRNLRYPLQRRGNRKGPGIDDAVALFELDQLLAHYPSQLSGGEARRVALARAVISAPQLLLLDEPLTGVDQSSKERLLVAIRALQQQLACPILYISHHIEEVSQIADHLMLLENGSITSQGPLLELCSRIDATLAEAQDAAAILECRVAAHDTRFALTELSCGNGQSMFLNTSSLSASTLLPGHLVRVRVPARDISIALSRAADSSILNILRVQIDALKETQDSKVLLRLKIGSQNLLASITRRSAEQLQLSIGLFVYAQIKSVALLNQTMVLPEQASGD